MTTPSGVRMASATQSTVHEYGNEFDFEWADFHERPGITSRSVVESRTLLVEAFFDQREREARPVNRNI